MATSETDATATTTSRSLPLPMFIEMFRDKIGRRDVGVGSIHTTLFHARRRVRRTRPRRT
jgi:hypothetical protein